MRCVDIDLYNPALPEIAEIGFPNARLGQGLVSEGTFAGDGAGETLLDR